jgi:hypothetical protein
MRDINKLKEDFENKIITQDDMTKEEVLALKNIYEKQIKELEKKDELLGKQVLALRQELDELLEKVKEN